MRKTLLLSLLLCATSAVAGAQAAQSKVSGVMKCQPPTTNESGGDRDQLITFSRSSCTWSTPLVVSGTKSTTANDVEIGEMNGGMAKGRGYSTSLMENGDSIVTRYEGTANIQQNGSATFKGTWRFVRGTGKFVGINGAGTYSGSGNDAGGTVNVTGHYVIAGGKGKKAK